MESPNRMALDLVDEAIDFAEELHLEVHHLDDEATVIDFGVEAGGGIEAGLLLSEVATGGLATVQTRVEAIADAALTHVEIATDHPQLSLLGCQSPRWELAADGATFRGSGPAQLFREDEEPPTDLQYEEEFDFAVLAVEADRLPGEAVVETVAATAGVPTSGVFVLAAPANSVAGAVAGAARVAERAVRRLEAVGADPADVRSVAASAPVAPSASSEAETRARSAAAVAEGGRAHVVVGSDVADPAALLQTDADDDNPAPAQLTVDVAGGPTHVVGGVEEGRLAEALGL